jgi:hypothetical protein
MGGPTPLTRPLPLAALAGALLCAPDARAVPAPPPPGMVAGPSRAGEAATALELVEAALEVTCEEPGNYLRCTLVTTTRLHNPTAAEVRQAIRLGPAVPAEATLDGQALPRAPQDRQRRDRVGPAVEALVPAGATRTLVVRSTFDVSNARHLPMFALPANTARHVVFANHQPVKTFSLRFAIGALRTWARASAPAPVRLALAVPRRYLVSSPLTASGEGRYGATFTSETLPTELSAELESPAPPVILGGLLAGIGGSTGAASGLRLRVGGELAARSWLFGSLVYETDAKSAHYAIVAAHAALPMVTAIPSLGAGLGVPVRLGPSVRAGARLALDAHLASLGFLAAFDLYPATATEPSLVQPSLFFQLAL